MRKKGNKVDFKISSMADKGMVMPIGNIKGGTGLGFSRFFEVLAQHPYKNVQQAIEESSLEIRRSQG